MCRQLGSQKLFPFFEIQPRQRVVRLNQLDVRCLGWLRLTGKLPLLLWKKRFSQIDWIEIKFGTGIIHSYTLMISR